MQSGAHNATKEPRHRMSGRFGASCYDLRLPVRSHASLLDIDSSLQRILTRSNETTSYSRCTVLRLTCYNGHLIRHSKGESRVVRSMVLH
eukprot:4433128-Pleurochrysis_carterae.AAC.2